jgi:Rho GDP-dissociation inhibitor
MSSNAQNDDLLPEQTEGYKVGEKKTIDEYHQMGMLVSSSAHKFLL